MQLQEAVAQLQDTLQQREQDLGKAEEALRLHLVSCSALATDSSEREARLLSTQAELRQKLAATQ